MIYLNQVNDTRPLSKQMRLGVGTQFFQKKENKMMTEKITSNQRKQIVRFVEDGIDAMNLEKDGAQRLIENGGEFQAELKKLVERFSITNQYANEVVSSSYTYPKEYKMKPIEEQVKFIAEKFGLDPTQALEFIKVLPALPEGAEGWFAIPKVSSVAKKHFSAITDSAEQYCEATKLVHSKLAESRSFYNYREDQITTAQIRQHPRTISFLEQLESEQQGDILILAVQYGLRHKGKSVRRARETFSGNEFGLGAFALGCMALVHPDRYVRWEKLNTDCAGDEFAPGAVGVFSRAPVFYFYDDKLKFDARAVSYAYVCFGSASAFVPQK